MSGRSAKQSQMGTWASAWHELGIAVLFVVMATLMLAPDTWIECLTDGGSISLRAARIALLAVAAVLLTALIQSALQSRAE